MKKILGSTELVAGLQTETTFNRRAIRFSDRREKKGEVSI